MTTGTKKTGIQEIELWQCHPAPWNKERPLTPDYLQSIEERGQQVVALLRPYPDPELEGQYMIVFGHRRWSALKQLGRLVIRAEVREMTDQVAEELAALENAQRAGLTWQQQCELIEGYLSKHLEEDAESRIAMALGLTTAQVRRRKKLLDGLSKSWAKAIKQNDLPAWTADHFETLTVFGEESQEAIFDDIGYKANGITLKDLREQLARDTKLLKGAPWKLDDDSLLPIAGACTACPKRSGVNADIFDEVDEKVKKGDRCLDEGCFAKKAEAHRERRVAVLKEDHPNLVKVSKDRWSTHDGILGSSSYKTAKKTDKGALPAVVMDGNGAGQLVWVKVDAEDKSAQSIAKRAEGGGKTPLKDRKAALEKRRTILVITKLIEWVKADDLDFPASDIPLLVALIYVFGTDRQSTFKTCDLGWKGVHSRRKALPAANDLWLRVRGVLVDQLQGELNRSKPTLNDATEIAALVSCDLAELRKQAEEEIPVPKSWAAEIAEGKAAPKDKPARKAKKEAAELEDENDDLDPDWDDEVLGDE